MAPQTEAAKSRQSDRKNGLSGDDLRPALSKLKAVVMRTGDQSSHRGPSSSDFMDKKPDQRRTPTE
jgi:hypothetical protein